jgi:hypothetical protein
MEAENKRAGVLVRYVRTPAGRTNGYPAGTRAGGIDDMRVLR